MKVFSFVAMFIAMLTFPAFADQDIQRSIATCAAEAGTLDRLSCYDDLAVELNIDGPQSQPVETDDVGNWMVEHDVNPIDDSETVYLVLESESGSNRLGHPVMFIARCQSEETEAYINWQTYVGDDSNDVYSKWKNVTYRIGSRDAVTERWGVATSNDATFAPNWAGNLLKDMTASDTFVAQLTPYGESPVTAVFDTTGMANALEPLMETCGWSL